MYNVLYIEEVTNNFAFSFSYSKKTWIIISYKKIIYDLKSNINYILYIDKNNKT